MEIVGSRKRKSLDAATEVFGPERAREDVRQRFQAELVAVQRLLKKAAAVPVPRSEEPPAKRSKKPSPPRVIKGKKMTRGERKLLKADLARLASELPDHIIELLMKHCRSIHGGEMEIDIDAVQDEAVIELREQLDEFVRQRADQEHQEEEEDVDIVGGVSPMAIVSAPLPLAYEEEDVDICGDASPVVIPKNLAYDATISGSPSSSSICDSTSDSGSRSDSDSSGSSDSDESVDSPAPAERATTLPMTELLARAKESRERQARCRAREKARQDLLETERTAMPTETIHWTVIKSFGIHEYGLGPYSLFRQLGLFLKVDDDQEEHRHRQSLEEELEEGEILDDYGVEEQQHRHPQIFQEELEEGEILG